jgi:hypothetical protein
VAMLTLIRSTTYMRAAYRLIESFHTRSDHESTEERFGRPAKPPS